MIMNKENGTPISKIVLSMIEKNSMRSLWYKHQVYWDVEDVHEATTDACIQLGLSSEEFSPYIIDKGDQIEILLQ